MKTAPKKTALDWFEIRVKQYENEPKSGDLDSHLSRPPRSKAPKSARKPRLDELDRDPQD